MRITPEQFDTIFNIVVVLILCFFGFVGLQILAMKMRWRDEEERRKQRVAKARSAAGEYQPVTRAGAATAATFGTSGMGASDMSPAADFTSSDLGSSFDSGGIDSSGGDSGGGGDFSGGGGDSGGGGASGGWSD